MDWTTVVTCIMTSLTTVAVAILGYYQTKRTKETAEYRKLRDQLEHERNEKLEDQKNKEELRLASLETSVNTMKDDVQTLKDDMKLLTQTNLTAITNQLSHLHTLQANSFSYMESLSKVVVVIGETLDDSDSVNANDKQRIGESISAHNKVESEIHAKLYDIIV